MEINRAPPVFVPGVGGDLRFHACFVFPARAVDGFDGRAECVVVGGGGDGAGVGVGGAGREGVAVCVVDYEFLDLRGGVQEEAAYGREDYADYEEEGEDGFGGEDWSEG